MLSLQELSDRYELQDLTYQYASAIDDRDFGALASRVFAPDAYLDFTSVGGPAGTLSELLEWAAPALDDFGGSHHLMANQQFTIDGDRATGRVMCYNPLARPDESDASGAVIIIGLYYIDEYVRTAAGWRIASRRTQGTYRFGTSSL